jgi:hypothetical protein
MDFLAAAIEILRSNRRPMTVAEITSEAMSRGLLKSAGKTPAATMSARLYTHVRDADVQRVRRVFEPGTMRAVRGTVRWELVES